VAKAHGSGHVFQVHCQPSRKTVTKMLFDRYDMNGLVHGEQIVTMYSYFDHAKCLRRYFCAVPSIKTRVSCFLSMGGFTVPDARTSVIGDNNSGRGCYRETYKKLEKNPQSG
jgi:hypothetical protein